jgi:hypothetical protein
VEVVVVVDTDVVEVAWVVTGMVEDVVAVVSPGSVVVVESPPESSLHEARSSASTVIIQIGSRIVRPMVHPPFGPGPYASTCM